MRWTRSSSGCRARRRRCASVERVLTERMAPSGAGAFAIRESPHEGEPHAAVAPDSATCDDCLAELFDPADRRHRYPFINCTNCGPRFTIVTDVPYDRPFTTMAGFQMCEACLAEYLDPADRRFHAQPNACPSCGPSLRLVGGSGDPLETVARALARRRHRGREGHRRLPPGLPRRPRAGRARLRSRKHREDKPFALMAPSARCCARADPGHARGGGAAQLARAAGGAGSRGSPARPWRTRWRRSPRARRDAALLPAPPPAGGRRGAHARDDERQRVRRADRLP